MTLLTGILFPKPRWVLERNEASRIRQTFEVCVLEQVRLQCHPHQLVGKVDEERHADEPEDALGSVMHDHASPHEGEVMQALSQFESHRLLEVGHHHG